MFSSLCRLFSRAGSNEIKGLVFFVGCDSHCHGLLNVCLFMWCILFFFFGWWIGVEALSHHIQTFQFGGQARGLLHHGFPWNFKCVLYRSLWIPLLEDSFVFCLTTYISYRHGTFNLKVLLTSCCKLITADIEIVKQINLHPCSRCCGKMFQIIVVQTHKKIVISYYCQC